MKLVKQVSLSEAKTIVQGALMDISDGGERARMTIALMQYQDALQREYSTTMFYGVAKLDTDGMVQEADYVLKSELELYIHAKYDMNIPELEILKAIEEEGEYKIKKEQGEEVYTLVVEPYKE